MCMGADSYGINGTGETKYGNPKQVAIIYRQRYIIDVEGYIRVL